MDAEIKNFIDRYEHSSFEGYDVYDAFNSPFAGLQKLKSNMLNVAVTQFFKNVPFNLRAVLAFKKSVNPKSLGLALEGAVIRQADPSFVQELVQKITETKSSFKNCSWGYNWDYYTIRGGRFPKHYPNAIATYFIGNALLEHYQVNRDARTKEMLDSIERFFLEDIHASSEASGICFSYSPADHKQIYNASALITKFLIDKNGLFESQANLSKIDQSLAYLAARQNADGSWFYGEEAKQKWVDSFHTEYMLELFETEYARNKYPDVLAKGRKFYIDNFLREGVHCNYFPKRLYPINIHSIASMIIYLSKIGERDKATPIIQWAMKHLYNTKTAEFYFEMGRFYKNTNVYHRWNQSWMYLALCRHQRS